MRNERRVELESENEVCGPVKVNYDNIDRMEGGREGGVAVKSASSIMCCFVVKLTIVFRFSFPSHPPFVVGVKSRNVRRGPAKLAFRSASSACVHVW